LSFQEKVENLDSSWIGGGSACGGKCMAQSNHRVKDQGIKSGRLKEIGSLDRV
jgi:hypothetical protein